MAFTNAYLSNTYWEMGDKARSNYYLKELESRMSEGEHHINLFIAMIYSARDDEERSIHYLEQAILKNEVGVALFTSIDPVFKALRSKVVFQKIRQEMQFQQ